MKSFKIFLSLIIWLSAAESLACQNSTDADRVVYIGDSHTVGTFGQKLAENLETVLDKLPVKRYGVIGAASQHWNKKDNSSLRKLSIGYYCDGEGQVNGKAPKANFPTPSQLFQGSPPMVVIALGTNDLYAKCKVTDKAEQMAAVKELLVQIRSNSKCIWVGPTEQPDAGVIGKKCGQPAIKAFIDNLEQTVRQRCTYIDSRDIKAKGKPILPNRSDNLHYSGELANFWADMVATRIKESSPSFLNKSPVHVPAPKQNNAQ